MNPFRHITVYFIAFSALAFVVLGLLSVQGYRGTLALRAQELGVASKGIALHMEGGDIEFLSGSLQDEKNAFYQGAKGRLHEIVQNTEHATYAVVIGDVSGVPRVYVDSEVVGGAFYTRPGEDIPAYIKDAYPQLTSGVKDAFVGRLQGTSGDVVVTATSLGDGTVLVVEYEARPFARAVFLATIMPMLLLTIIYAILALIYFWFKEKERALLDRHLHLASVARDIYIPLLGAQLRVSHDSLGKKKTRTPSLVAEVGDVLSVAIPQLRKVIDGPRLERSFQREGKVVKTDTDVVELVRRSVTLHDSFIKAKGIEVRYAKDLPKSMTVVVDGEKIERACIRVISYLAENAEPESKIHIAGEVKKNEYTISYSALLVHERTPHALFVADRVMRLHGGAVSVSHDKHTGAMTIRFVFPKNK